ncbi:MAG: DUF1460 domain-containing protein [Gemmatimonadetes bacterium]|nr:DUF1460 domain-containing protein [Gemmatimonadota bacterium]
MRRIAIITVTTWLAVLVLAGATAVVRHAAREPGAAQDATPYSTDLERDRQIFREKMEWARRERLDTLPLGEIIARLGATFVGTTYTPATLEAPGPERLVVNLRELDCVTFVENMLVMARLIRERRSDFGAYLAELTRVRYRGGWLDGYPSRLHYFSEWLADNQQKGLLREIGRELGGIPDDRPIHFMSRHPDAYRQLADPGNLAAIRGIEERLSGGARTYVAESRIDEAAPGIRNGDIIAAKSTLDGLDVAHTGIALWVDGRLHLMHAPLVGSAVEISEVPLAERILRITSQDGILVARPL